MQYSNFSNIVIENALGVSPVAGDTMLIAERGSQLRARTVLDIGTGTGFIPIYLATKGKKCVGTDINEYALQNARKNAERNHATCTFLFSDLFSNIKGKFDLITFNPPFGNTGSTLLTRPLELVKSLIPKNNDLFIWISFWLIRKQRGTLIKRFLHDAPHFLTKNGDILLLVHALEIDLIRSLSYARIGDYKQFHLVKISSASFLMHEQKL